MEKVYDSIFDAVQSIEPCSPLIQLGGNEPRFFVRTNEYQLVRMHDDSLVAFPGMIPMQLFRGENKIYNSCKPSIYRSDNPDDVILDELRILELKQVISTFPQVQYAIEDHMRVDYLALAQHYELNTKLIDLTASVEVAAYFATHHWENGIARPVESGVGCIRGILSPMLTETMQYSPDPNPKYHMIGLQCFERPGLQAAYGLELDKSEDMDDRCWKVYFRQNIDASRIIHRNFHIDIENAKQLYASRTDGAGMIDPGETEAGWLFPPEEIADIAKGIKNSNTISKTAVEEYGKPVDDVLRRKGITVTDSPIYVLSEAHRRELEKYYKDRPYGDVDIKVRLSAKVMRSAPKSEIWK